jgi:type IV secretory pathway protease TraF
MEVDASAKKKGTSAMEGEEQIVWNGSRVAIDLVARDGSVERLAFQIVPDELADFERGYLGKSTPMVRAIVGRAVGEHVAYPIADLSEIHIVGAQEAEQGPDESVAERRAATLRNALKQSELVNMIAFAASFNSKWGDYDPQSLTDEWEGRGPEEKRG